MMRSRVSASALRSCLSRRTLVSVTDSRNYAAPTQLVGAFLNHEQACTSFWKDSCVPCLTHRQNVLTSLRLISSTPAIQHQEIMPSLLPTMTQERHENRTVRFCRVLHSSSECLAEKSETEGKPDDRTDTESSPGPPPEAKSIRGSPVTWLSLGLLLVTGAGLVYYYDQEKKRLIKDFKEESKPGPGVGKAAIGGPFNLVNHEGKEVTEQDFKGNWTLVYFGFTHCPDICPDELQKLAEAVDVIEKKDGIRITPVFISVDPERDNVEQVREYVREFHPRLIGLTGTPDSIKKVAREFRVYYMKTEEEGSDYLVDHSIIMYLMDPQMDFIKFFGKNYDVKGLADGIVEEIKRHKQ